MKNNRSQTEVWAHRGFSSQYPENTLAAFRAAIACGVQGIELDVHMTKDGQLVILHDERVDRTTNCTGEVKEFLLRDLKQLDAGSWFSSAFTGEQIPTLEEFLTLMAETTSTVRLNIEFKTDVVDYPNIDEQAWKLVTRFHLQHQVIFSSFNHYTLKRLKTRHSEAHMGLLYSDGLVEPWRYASFMNASALHPDYRTFPNSVVRDAHAQGIRVHTWTVDDEVDMLRLRAARVDAIITNKPDVALRLYAKA